MRNLILAIVLVLSIYGCTTVEPVYIARTNQYPVRQYHSGANNLVAADLIYSYTTKDLETDYEQLFCAYLSNCSQNVGSVKNHPQFGGFDLSKKPIANNAYQIESISAYRLRYTTTGQLGEARTVSGAVFLPQTASKNIKGVLLFFHPTFFSKDSVPSYATDKRSDKALAAIFASDGYIVVAPDYIGMGYDKDTFHPYVVYPQVNANDGLSMLSATRQFLQQNNLFESQILPLYVSGYSEGGAYALWFSRLYQEQTKFKTAADSTGFKLSKVVPISGAYDLSGVVYSYLFSDIGIFTKSSFNVSSSVMAGRIKPSLLAYSLSSYAYYNESQNFNRVFNPQFFSMGCATDTSPECLVNGHPVNVFNEFYYSQGQRDRAIVNKVNEAANSQLYNSNLYMNQWNGLSPLVNPNMAKSPEFMRFLHRGDIYYWNSTIPTTLLYLKYDSVVSSLNSIHAYQGMKEARSSNLNQIELDNSVIKENVIDYLPAFDVDHLTAFYYLFIIARTQFNS